MRSTGPAQKQHCSGTLLTLDNQIDTTTGTVKARAAFANKDSALFPNQFVNTRLLVKTLKGVTLIPTGPCSTTGQAAFVYVLEDNKAHMRPITVGVTDGQTAQVQGINPGDVLATSSFDKLQDNAQVTSHRHVWPRLRWRAGQTERNQTLVRRRVGGWARATAGEWNGATHGQARAGKHGHREQRTRPMRKPRVAECKSLSPSRPFILRPVATSLLMVAILLVGIVAYYAAASFCAAGG